MTADASKQRKCPSCGRMAPKDSPTSPFCSKQCKMVDLGSWFLEEYRIPVRQPDPEDLEALAEAVEQAQTEDEDVH